MIVNLHHAQLWDTFSWAKVRDNVRAGLGATLYPVGHIFTVYDSSEGRDAAWRVVGHDHHAAADDSLAHAMTLERVLVYSYAGGNGKNIQFDGREALYYAESGLSPGVYHFTVADQIWCKADNGKTFQFTLTDAVPAGGQLVLNMVYNATLEGKSVVSYANSASVLSIESAVLTEGTGGTDLGTADGGSPGVNHMQRAIFGSNNYAQSAVRQFLNRSVSAGEAWTPTNKFDRPPQSFVSGGFMQGLPDEFLAVVQAAVIPCRTTSVFEADSLDGNAFSTNQVYTLEDKFFLLSRPEIYGNWDSADHKDGTRLEWYNGTTAEQRIRRDANGNIRSAWMRSPNPGNAAAVRTVVSDGMISGAGASGGQYICPACIIA